MIPSGAGVLLSTFALSARMHEHPTHQTMQWVSAEHKSNAFQVVLSPRPLDQLRANDYIRVQTLARPADVNPRLAAGETYQLHLPAHAAGAAPALIDPNTGQVAEDVADAEGSLVLVGLIPTGCVGVRYAKFVSCSRSLDHENASSRMAVAVQVVA